MNAKIETKKFSTAVVLSIISERLLCEIDDLYKVLEWMTGETLMTHQLPRVGREALPVILAMHPHLAKVVEDEEKITSKNWSTWLELFENRYGKTIAVPRMTADQHERIEPVSELAEKIHPSKIAGVRAME